MGLDITSSARHINFATNNNTSIIGLTQKTILVWCIPVNSANGSTLCTLVQQAGPGTNEYWYIIYNLAGTAGRVGFFSNWSSVGGAWHTGSNLLTTGVPNLIGVTYDAGSTTNDPIIYLNGASVSITESAAPSGTWRSGTNSEIYIGTFLASTPNCNTLSLCYYNRILSAAEIADAYNSRKFIPTYRGLVFAPNLCGAAGLQTFDGTTLGGTNYIIDSISGAQGTPSGSPVGRGDTYLNF